MQTHTRTHISKRFSALTSHDGLGRGRHQHLGGGRGGLLGCRHRRRVAAEWRRRALAWRPFHRGLGRGGRCRARLAGGGRGRGCVYVGVGYGVSPVMVTWFGPGYFRQPAGGYALLLFRFGPPLSSSLSSALFVCGVWGGRRSGSGQSQLVTKHAEPCECNAARTVADVGLDGAEVVYAERGGRSHALAALAVHGPLARLRTMHNASREGGMMGRALM